MQIEKVEFYYFSGTGNTIILVEKMVETFKNMEFRFNFAHREIRP